MTRRIITGCDAVHPDRRGGQHVAMSCSGVLIIDDEAELGVFCNTERSQIKNRSAADELLDELVAGLNGPTVQKLTGESHAYEACADGSVLVYATCNDTDGFPVKIEADRVGALMNACIDAMQRKRNTY